MKPDVKKIIADIKATKGNRKFCNGLAGTLQDDNYASSICKYVKTVTPERIDLLIEYAEKLEAEVTDMAVQLANAESKCRELAGVVAENADLKSLIEQHAASIAICPNCSHEEPSETDDIVALYRSLKTPDTDDFLAEVRASAIPDEATERDLFEEWVMEKICISKTTMEGLRTDDGYRNSTLSGTDYNGMWSQWKAIRAAQLRKGAAL
ncbi:hypothetical protein OGV35_10470 [Citrobacter sp. Cb016]|uniref:hypothetical protein n=1 Tax=Citrobacter TaxID=544 RepID=UPI00257CD734|nr:hypothetical protein [Citrobacter sp. Cb016]MDM3398174.1 hypothetical protein [Citrobacter sp. Cb016]